jgi:hypothetical protein
MVEWGCSRTAKRLKSFGDGNDRGQYMNDECNGTIDDRWGL